MLMSVYHFPAPFEKEHLLGCLMRYVLPQGRKEYVKVAKRVSSNVSKVNSNSYWQSVYTDILKQYLPKYHHQIALNNTLLNVYTSLIESDFSTVLAEQVKYPSKLQLKHAILEQVHKGWKWCPECIFDDEDECGIAYWHCEHQFPLKKRCTKHGALLLSGCQCCGFAWSSILQGPGPSASCPKCGSTFSERHREDSYDDLWIERSANGILNGSLKFDKNKVKECLKVQYGFGEFKRQWSVAERKKISDQQDLFGKWIDSLNLLNHLTPFPNRMNNSEHPAFNVSTYVFKSYDYAPIIHLLFSRYCREVLC